MLNYNKKLFSYKDMFEQLVDLDTKKKLPPRLLLSGQKGIGKRTFSFHLINYLFSISLYDLSLSFYFHSNPHESVSSNLFEVLPPDNFAQRSPGHDSPSPFMMIVKTIGMMMATRSGV